MIIFLLQASGFQRGASWVKILEHLKQTDTAQQH